MRRSGRDPKRWNEACDYAINPILLDAGLHLPEGVLVDDRFREMSAEQIYNQLQIGSRSKSLTIPMRRSRERRRWNRLFLGASSRTTPMKAPFPVTEGGIGQVLDAPAIQTTRLQYR